MAQSKLLFFLLTILLVGALVLESSSTRWRPSDNMGRKQLYDHNEGYLDHATEDAFATFLLLSGMKAGLAVMSSSSAGVSFIVDMNVQVGEMVASASDVVEYGWRASLVGLSVLGGLRVVMEALDAVAPLLVQALLAALLCYSLASVFLRSPPAWLTGLLRVVVLVAGVGCIGVPISIGLAGFASEKMTGSCKEDVRKQLHSHHEALSMDHSGDVKSQAHAGIKNYTDNASKVTEKHRHLTEQVVRHLVVVLFDAILFPFGVLLGMVQVFRRMTRTAVVRLAATDSNLLIGSA